MVWIHRQSIQKEVHMVESNQDTQGQNAPDAGTKVDEYATKLDAGNPDKAKTFLQNTYSSEELVDILTKESVVVDKSIKKAYNADLSRAGKQSELDIMKNLSKRADLSPEKPTDKGTGSKGEMTPEEEKYIARYEAAVKRMEDIEKLDERFSTIDEKLKSAEGRTQSLESMHSSQEVRIRNKRLQEGFEEFKETLGEAEAIALYDPEHPEKTGIGQLLHPESIDDSTPEGKVMKEWAQRRSPLCYDYVNPVLGALRFLGMGDVMTKAFGKQVPETESAGKATLGDAVLKGEPLKEHFFGGVLGIKKK